ncbi:MAG: PTS sugar transporter subunit IIC [Pseudomonadota bacterium]
MWADVIWVSIIGGLIALDRTAALQVMISRPMAAGPLVGLALGRPMEGLQVGVLVELLWISKPPLGGYIPPNECLTAILASAAVIMVAPESAEPSRALITLGILVVIPPVRFFFPPLETQLRRWNGRLAAGAVLAVSRGKTPFFPGLNLLGLLPAYLGATLFILIILGPAVLILKFVYQLLPPPVLTALDWLFFCLPLIGAASVLGAINVKRSGMIYALAFAGALSFFMI